jgi:predicted dehydrogenase
MSQNDSIDRRNFLAGSVAGVAGCALSGRAMAGPAAKKVRYGIVGAGNRGLNTHLRIVKKYLSDTVEVGAICDITPANLQVAVEASSGAKGYSDYKKMIAEERQLDAVIVVVPNFVHADVAVAALQAGKHVLCEKPMAIHLAEADRMIQAAQKSHCVLQVGQQSRYSIVYEQMAKLIRDKAIGDLEYVSAALFRGDWNPRSWRYKDPATGQETNWRFLTKCAGSSLLEDGIHELDVIHWLVGAHPTRIQATGGNNVFKDRETIDNAGLLIDFSNGVRCAFAYTVFTPGVQNSRGMRLFGSKAEMTVEGSRGESEIVIRPYRGQPERIPAPRIRPEEASFKDQAGGVDADIETLRLHKAFVASTANKAPVFADGKVGKDAIHISLAAERSLRTGQVISWEKEAGI